MAQYPLNQSSISRAWVDTKNSFHKIFFFWVVEVIATGLGVFVGTIVTPEDAGRTTSAMYPTIGGLVGVLAGFAIIFIINLIPAPYRQRNEARKLVSELKSEGENEIQRAQLRQELGLLIIEGTEVLKGFKSVRTFADAWPVEEFKAWLNKTSSLLDKYKLTDDYVLWFRDVSIEISESTTLNDFINACEAGLERLENIMARFRD